MRPLDVKPPPVEDVSRFSGRDSSGRPEMWEFNPAYRCGLVDKRGMFKGLVEEAMRSVGVLSLNSRLSCFDDDGCCSCDVEPPDTESSFESTSSFDALNLILIEIADLMGRLESLEGSSSRRLVDRELLRNCDETLTMIDDELYSCSMDNHAATGGVHLPWDDDSTMDNISTIVSETPPSESSPDDDDYHFSAFEDPDGLGIRVVVQTLDSSDDLSSESSDVEAWKNDIFMSAFDEFDFDVMDYRHNKILVNQLKKIFHFCACAEECTQI